MESIIKHHMMIGNGLMLMGVPEHPHVTACGIVTMVRCTPKCTGLVADPLKEVVATDERESWVTDTVAESAADLASSLMWAAPEVEFRDDAGHEYAIPKVHNDLAVMHLIGTHVAVTGRPDRDARGRVTSLRYARVALAADPFANAGIPAGVDFEQSMSSVPGPKQGGIADLTDDEVLEAYMTPAAESMPPVLAVGRTRYAPRRADLARPSPLRTAGPPSDGSRRAAWWSREGLWAWPETATRRTGRSALRVYPGCRHVV